MIWYTHLKLNRIINPRNPHQHHKTCWFNTEKKECLIHNTTVTDSLTVTHGLDLLTLVIFIQLWGTVSWQIIKKLYLSSELMKIPLQPNPHNYQLTCIITAHKHASQAGWNNKVLLCHAILHPIKLNLNYLVNLINTSQHKSALTNLESLCQYTQEWEKRAMLECHTSHQNIRNTPYQDSNPHSVKSVNFVHLYYVQWLTNKQSSKWKWIQGGGKLVI